jgi:hypothetical protein
LGTYCQIIGAPGFDRSSAYTMLGNEVWTYIRCPNQRVTLLAPERPHREHPDRLEVLHVRRRDLLEGAVPL